MFIVISHNDNESNLIRKRKRLQTQDRYSIFFFNTVLSLTHLPNEPQFRRALWGNLRLENDYANDMYNLSSIMDSSALFYHGFFCWW